MPRPQSYVYPSYGFEDIISCTKFLLKEYPFYQHLNLFNSYINVIQIEIENIINIIYHNNTVMASITIQTMVN
jgi:hypothetical protein